MLRSAISLSQRKKILFLSSWYPVPHNPTHGIFVQRHAQAVSALHDVFVLYCAGAESETSLSDIKRQSPSFTEWIRFYNKTEVSRLRRFLALRSLYRNSFNELVKTWGKPDLIHLNVIFPAGIFAFSFAKQQQIPMVVTEHWTGYLPEDGSFKGAVKKHVAKRIVAYASAVCPVTSHLANAMQLHGLAGKYYAVPNVVDTDAFTPAIKRDKSGTVFLHLSSFDERQKNPRSIIDAFIKVHETDPSVSLIMAGDGDNIGELKEYTRGHSAIRFHYRPVGDDLLKLFQRADALVLNSNYENLPVVLLEAMSCGLPVISSNVGGIAEYVNEKNGILFSPPSVNALAEAMFSFIRSKEKFDPVLIREFAVSNFSRQRIAAAYSDIYTGIIC